MDRNLVVQLGVGAIICAVLLVSLRSPLLLLLVLGVLTGVVVWFLFANAPPKKLGKPTLRRRQEEVAPEALPRFLPSESEQQQTTESDDLGLFS